MGIEDGVVGASVDVAALGIGVGSAVGVVGAAPASDAFGTALGSICVGVVDAGSGAAGWSSSLTSLVPSSASAFGEL